jgi:hypothetical protein
LQAPRQATIDYFIDFTVTFNGQSTDTTSIITTSDNTNTQEGVCTYGICQEITSASGGTIIGADGSPTPIENPPQPSPTPERKCKHCVHCTVETSEEGSVVELAQHA